MHAAVRFRIALACVDAVCLSVVLSLLLSSLYPTLRPIVPAANQGPVEFVGSVVVAVVVTPVVFAVSLLCRCWKKDVTSLLAEEEEQEQETPRGR